MAAEANRRAATATAAHTEWMATATPGEMADNAGSATSVVNMNIDALEHHVRHGAPSPPRGRRREGQTEIEAETTRLASDRGDGYGRPGQEHDMAVRPEGERNQPPYLRCVAQ